MNPLTVLACFAAAAFAQITNRGLGSDDMTDDDYSLGHASQAKSYQPAGAPVVISDVPASPAQPPVDEDEDVDLDDLIEDGLPYDI